MGLPKPVNPTYQTSTYQAKYSVSSLPSPYDLQSSYSNSRGTSDTLPKISTPVSSIKPSTSTSGMSIINRKASSDLMMKIQASKDDHTMFLEQAKKYESSKPLVIAPKTLPRPEQTFDSSKELRRLEREKQVIDRVMEDRVSRGKSDDNMLSRSRSYRL